ncbi:MAG TPA: PEP-CTERM sorting domain-containing protein [Chthoniobacterales bacterium]|nr:PEP-CTERM sorting domain-containing protein [Chthoniobacterales bacterium]
MKKLLLSTTVLCFALGAPAMADVQLLTQLSGTGDNVVSDSSGTNSALGHLNGQHLDVVRYTDLATGFTFAANGNDIKIGNTGTLTDQVFDPTNTFLVGTTTEVFSLTGTGDVKLAVNATDGTFNFDLGTIGNGQSGFTVNAINGEVINSLTLTDSTGSLFSFEHNRIETASAVPEPATWGMLLLGFVGLAFAFKNKRRKISFA